MCQKLGHGLVGASVSRCLTGCNRGISWAAEISRFNWGISTPIFTQVMVTGFSFLWIFGWRQPSVSCHVGLSTGQLTTWCLHLSEWARERAREGKQIRNWSISNLILEVASHHFCGILFASDRSPGPVYSQGSSPPSHIHMWRVGDHWEQF